MNFDTITLDDIELLFRLAKDDYPDLSLEKVAGKHDKSTYDNIGEKLKTIADAINEEYGSSFGPFHSVKSTGNAIGIGGKLGRLWAGVFKGNENKQYSPQITVGIDHHARLLYLGFFFGSAYSKSAEPLRRKQLENGLDRLGGIMYKAIQADSKIRHVLDGLLELGFKCYVKERMVSLEEWIENLSIDPKISSINIFLPADKHNKVDEVLIRYYISVCVPLMSVFPDNLIENSKRREYLPRPRTPEERAVEAARRTIIGIKGEEFAMDYEKKKLAVLKLTGRGYPKHIAAISDVFHYDICSIDRRVGEIHIEVKTTARHSSDPLSKIAYMSAQEYEFYKTHKESYRLYRVYDIFGEPEIQEVDLNDISFLTDNYRIVISV